MPLLIVHLFLETLPFIRIDRMFRGRFADFLLVNRRIMSCGFALYVHDFTDNEMLLSEQVWKIVR